MSPDLGEFADQADLIEALVASGPLDNQLTTSSTPKPSPSICADVVKYRDPTIGDVVHQVIATLNGQTGVVLVYLRPDGSEEVGMFETSVSCLTMFQTPLPNGGDDVAAATTTPSTEVVATTQDAAALGSVSLDSALGEVSYVLPPGSWADPQDIGQLDDVTVGHAWWIVPDCCYLKVTLQDFVPPRPTEEHVGQFESNRLTWDLYDIGPRDGSTIVATATVDGLTISVGAQGQSGVSTDPSPSQIAESVARTVLVD